MFKLSFHAKVGADVHPGHGPDAEVARPIIILGNLLNPEKISPMLAGWLRLDAGLRLSQGGIRGMTTGALVSGFWPGDWVWAEAASTTPAKQHDRHHTNQRGNRELLIN